MTTIPPPAQPPPTPPTPSPRALPIVAVASPPAGLLKLAAGARFEGTVVAEGTDIAVRVATAYGTLQIQTTLPLSRGQHLHLVLHTLTPPQLQIAAVDGKPPALPRAPAAAPAAAGAGSGAATGGPAFLATAAAGGAPPTTPRGLIGASLTATLLRPAVAASAGAGPMTTPTASAAAGTAIAPATLPAAPGPSGLPPPVAAAGAPSPAAPGVPAAPAPGTWLPVRVVAVHPPVPGAPPPAAPPSAPAFPAVGQTMSGQVIGHTPGNQPVLHTPAGLLTLSHPVPLPRGAEVVMAVTGPPTPPAPDRSALPSPPPLPAAALFRARTWPTLAEAYQALQNLRPAAAQEMAANVLPQAGARLSAEVLFFLAALRGGDLASWLTPEAARVLRRERPELMNRLGEEFRQVAALAREPVAGDWRIALVPFLAGAEIEQLRLFLRPYGDEEDGDTAPKGIRFIVDVELSRLGRLQLDGLVRDDSKRLDLIVRSEQPLPPAMQNDIRAIFEEANEITGVAGGLGFQSAPPDFVEVAPESGAPKGPGLFA